jgi:2-isopropylmalate synthase
VTTVKIYDTTLRDGAQGEGISFSLQDKLQISKRLDEVGVDYIEGGYPLSNEKDAEFFSQIREAGLQNTKVCAFGMTRRKGVSAAADPGMVALLASQAPVTTIVGKTWDFHVTEVLRVTLEENLAMISDSLALMNSEGREVIYDAEHFFDGWKANADYAVQTLIAAAESGANAIVFCDTNGGTTPREISEIVSQAGDVLRSYNCELGIHCHNDCDLAVANSLFAIEAGCRQVQGTINGIGERCGNADLISILANLGVKNDGYQVLQDLGLESLTELSRFVSEVANMNLRNGQPFVGQSAFAHKGGMHVHAVNRSASSYEHIDPQSVGNERRILVSELSGRSNIQALTKEYGLDHDRELMGKILARVITLESQGYQYEAAEASFDLLVRKCAGLYSPFFQRIKYHVEVASDGSSHGEQMANSDPAGPIAGVEKLVTEATVKLKVQSDICHEVAEGDGPVNALDNALRKGLTDFYPALQEMRLVDYKVRVVNSVAGTAAKIRVNIESADHDEVWRTIGVSENIIEASWLALVDAIDYKLSRNITSGIAVDSP